MNIFRNAFIGIAIVGVCIVNFRIPSVQAQEAKSRPVLHEFIMQIIAEHPTLRSAKANFRATQALAKGKSKPVYNPELEFGYERAEVNTKEIGISQTFDISGKRSSLKSVGHAEVTAAEIVYSIEKKKLITSILRRLADYQTAFKIYAVTKRKAQISVEFLAIMEKSQRSGQQNQSSLLTAKLTLSEAMADQNRAWHDLSESEESLVAIMGQDKGSWPILNGTPAISSLEKHNINELPEILLAMSNTEISRAQIKVAQSETGIDPTVGFRAGKEGRQGIMGFNLSMPIPVRNNRKSGVKAANEYLIKAQQEYFAIRREVSARYAGSRKRFQAVSEAWESWRKQGVVPLKKQRNLLNKLLRANEIGTLDYLIQLNQTFEVEIASLELNGRLWNAAFAWQEASNSFDSWLKKIQ